MKARHYAVPSKLAKTAVVNATVVADLSTVTRSWLNEPDYGQVTFDNVPVLACFCQRNKEKGDRVFIKTERAAGRLLHDLPNKHDNLGKRVAFLPDCVVLLLSTYIQVGPAYPNSKHKENNVT